MRISVSSLVEQAIYNRPRVVDRSKQKVAKDVLEAYQLAQRLQSMVGPHQLLNSDIKPKASKLLNLLDFELTDWLCVTANQEATCAGPMGKLVWR